MDFAQIKDVVRYALGSKNLGPSEQEAIVAAIQSDVNKQRAEFLVEMLNLKAAH
ncbi:MAG: hypothetical protein AAF268_05630 [Cyanobacteria bacterium P01_A01_bin.3]